MMLNFFKKNRKSYKILIDENIIQYSIPYEPVYQPIISSQQFNEEPLENYNCLKAKYDLNEWNKIVGPVLTIDVAMPLRELIQKKRVKICSKKALIEKIALYGLACVALNKIKGPKLNFYRTEVNTFESFESSGKNNAIDSSFYSYVPIKKINSACNPFKFKPLIIDPTDRCAKTVKERLLDFCHFLKNIESQEEFANLAFKNNIINQFEMNNLTKVNRYKTLCKHSNNKYIDCLYLWTAEVNGIDYFLTTDRKFKNSVQGYLKNTQPILPSDLITTLNISPDSIAYPFIEGEISDVM